MHVRLLNPFFPLHNSKNSTNRLVTYIKETHFMLKERYYHPHQYQDNEYLW